MPFVNGLIMVNRLIQFCAMNNMKKRISLFDHKHIHRIMRNSNDHCTCTQISHITIGPRWRVYRGADALSDHQLIIVKIKIKLKGQNRKIINVRRLDSSKLIDPYVEG